MANHKKIQSNIFYEKNVLEHSSLLKQKNSLSTEITTNRNIPIIDFDTMHRRNEMCISYISDIHIDHKLKRKFKNIASKNEIVGYFRRIATKIYNNMDKTSSNTLLIAGDVSFSYDISKLFYTTLREILWSKQIYVVLGNHELWDYKLLSKSKKSNLDAVDYYVEKYRELFSSLRIELIQNELVCLKYPVAETPFYEHLKLNEEEINNLSTEQIRDFTKSSILTILGGIGFSGYSSDFNATNLIYRDIFTDLPTDLSYTQRFENIYKKSKEALSDKKIIVFTHTPKANWSTDKYCSNWIYVNGHTHRNVFIDNEETVLYADNQIGYEKGTIGLKHFYLSKDYDVFSEYADGIYEISRIEYLDFYRGHGQGIHYNRENTKIHMLKKNEIYCFIQENLENGKFYILSGGSIKKLTHQGDLSYYFENMDLYSESITMFIRKYNETLEKISVFVKSIGGSGHIHGSIVDIDFYNHLFLNPFDGQMTPYFAYSMTSKYVYKNIDSLLFHNCKKLYSQYSIQINTEEGKRYLALLNDTSSVISSESNYVSDTRMYSFSRIIKNLQYITNIKVIRSWNEEIIDNKSLLQPEQVLFLDFIERDKNDNID
jgi:predicted MPP superfamily phosphohydrolase